jgi:hypothetical protein
MASCHRGNTCTTSYTNGPFGERTTMTLPGGGTWHYEYTMRPVGYDLENKGPVLTKLTDDQGRSAEYQTDLQGGMDKVRYNEVYNQYGALVSYCQAHYRYDSLTGGTNGGNSKLELKTLSTTFTWPNTYGYPQTRILNQNDYTTDNAGNSNTISVQNLNADGTPTRPSANPSPGPASAPTAIPRSPLASP